MSMFYSEYRGRSIGRIIYFIGCYCGSNIRDAVTIGSDTVTLYGKEFARIEWNNGFGEADLPRFIFLESHPNYDKIFEVNQAIKWKEAMEDAVRYNQYGRDGRENLEVDILKILIPEGYRTARLFASISKKEPSFFTAIDKEGRALYCDVWDGRYYRWDLELKQWLLAGFKE